MTIPSRTEKLEAAHEKLEEAVRLLESADEPLLADEADLADAVDLRIVLTRPSR
jgi:exonuclease VII small subunit